MLNAKDYGIICDILRYCERVISKVEKTTKESFIIDLDTREIVCFNPFQIGELAKKLSDSFIENNRDIPWKYIKGMRDHIVHGYGTIDLEIVWQTVQQNIKELQDYCHKILS